MTSEEKNQIKVFSKCDFSKIGEYYKIKAEERRNMSKEEKNVRQHGLFLIRITKLLLLILSLLYISTLSTYIYYHYV